MDKQWALITGASSGIGRAMAISLAQAGYRTMLVARQAGALSAVAGEIEGLGAPSPMVVAADLSTGSGRADVASAIDGRDVRVAVLAAGFGLSGPFNGVDRESEKSMLEVNCTAVVELSHRLSEQMRQQGRGTIVLFGSLVGWQGVPMSATYAATKAFVQSLGEALAVELAPSGVNVLCCAPGPVHSGFAARANMVVSAGDDADSVAQSIMRNLSKRGTIVPGRFGKFLTTSLSTLPRSLRVRIMGRIMSGMANH